MHRTTRLVALGVTLAFSLAATCSAHADPTTSPEPAAAETPYNWMWGFGTVIVVLLVYLCWTMLIRVRRRTPVAPPPQPLEPPQTTPRAERKKQSRSDRTQDK